MKEYVIVAEWEGEKGEGSGGQRKEKRKEKKRKGKTKHILLFSLICGSTEPEQCWEESGSKLGRKWGSKTVV